MYKEKIVQKAYHTISEVAEKTKIAQTTIRFWESEFHWFRPKRGRGNQRLYNIKELNKLNCIIILTTSGVTLEGIKAAHKDKYLVKLTGFFLVNNKSKLFNVWKLK